MDKLEPILKNHFWILLVPLLSMNLWGYFSANGAMKEATKAREGVLDTVKSGVPAGTTNPNEVYTTELTQRNEVLEKYVNEELLDLWKRQQNRMVWPARVADNIPKVYQEEIKDQLTRFTYQNDYPNVIRQLHESVEPFVADQRGITWTPKVDFPIQLIPQMKIPKFTIESKPMWDAQEDIWVTQLILDVIRQMNKDADSETSAVIRRVIAYRLLGGDGVAGGGAAGEAASGGLNSSGAVGMGGEEMAAGFGNSGGGGGQGAIASSVKFDPAEEFGAGGEPAGGGGGMGNGMGISMEPGMGNSGESGVEGAEATADAGPLRYVKLDENSPYVERGFYLSVVINQNKIVDFLVALSNSEWPVRVVRFHFGKNPYGGPDPFTAAAAGGGGMANAGFGGRGPGGGLGASGMGAGLNRPTSGGSGGNSGLPSGGIYPEGGAEPGSGGLMGGAGRLGGGGGNAASTGYPPDALTHPDLVQLDLAGIVTMYKQPQAAKPVVADPAAEGTPTPAPSAEAAADATVATPTEQPATPEAPDSVAVAESAAPASPETPPADAAPEAPAPENPAVPAAEGTPATPAPAVEGAPPAEPPATPPASP